MHAPALLVRRLVIPTRGHVSTRQWFLFFISRPTWPDNQGTVIQSSGHGRTCRNTINNDMSCLCEGEDLLCGRFNSIAHTFHVVFLQHFSLLLFSMSEIKACILSISDGAYGGEESCFGFCRLAVPKFSQVGCVEEAGFTYLVDIKNCI